MKPGGTARIIAALLSLLSLGLAGRLATATTIGVLPLPAPQVEPAATLLLLQLVEQELHRTRPELVIVRGTPSEAASCPTFEREPARCLPQVAGVLRAERLLAGQVTGSSGDYQLWLLDQAVGGSVAATAEPRPASAGRARLRTSADGLALVLRPLVRRFLVAGELLPAGQGGLLLRPDPAGASARLDGAQLVVGPALLAPLAAGEHEIELSLPGHRSVTSRTTVRPAEIGELRTLLAPGADGLPAPGWASWTALGAGTALLGGGVVFGLLARSTQEQFDGTAVHSGTVDELVRQRQQGEDRARYANVSFALAGASLLTSAALWYLFDWREQQQAVRFAERAARARHPVDAASPVPLPPPPDPTTVDIVPAVAPRTTDAPGGDR